MLDFPLSTPKPDTQLCRAAIFIDGDPDFNDRNKLAKEIGIPVKRASSFIHYLKWANFDVRLAATKIIIRSRLSEARGKFKKETKIEKRNSIRAKIVIFENRLRNLEDYRDAQRVGL